MNNQFNNFFCSDSWGLTGSLFSVSGVIGGARIGGVEIELGGGRVVGSVMCCASGESVGLRRCCSTSCNEAIVDALCGGDVIGTGCWDDCWRPRLGRVEIRLERLFWNYTWHTR